MIFTNYRKVLVLNFLEVGNTIFLAKKLMERWYLLITEKFYFELFGDVKYSIFLSQRVDGKMKFNLVFRLASLLIFYVIIKGFIWF